MTQLTIIGASPSEPTFLNCFGDALAAAFAEKTALIGFIGLDVTVDDWLPLAVEANRLFELHQDLAGVGGRLIGDDGCVAESCFVGLPDGSLRSPQVGLQADDAGPFALALKPHSVAVPSTRLSLFSTAFLARNRDELIECESREEFILLASRLARVQGLRLAFSPLISARIPGAERRVMLNDLADDVPRKLGMSAFASAARYHA